MDRKVIKLKKLFGFAELIAIHARYTQTYPQKLWIEIGLFCRITSYESSALFAGGFNLKVKIGQIYPVYCEYYAFKRINER